MIRSVLIKLALLLGVALLCSCSAASTPLQIEDPRVSQVWPEAPEAPRIKLLRILEGAEGLVDKDTQKSRLFRWLTGDMTEQLPLVAPYGVTTDGHGRIWISDPGAHAIHLLDLNTRRAQLWTLAGEEFFRSPTGISYDASQKRIYVADSLRKKVVALSEKGKFLFEFKTTKPFTRPGGLAVAPSGQILVADVLGGKLRRFSSDGIELSSYGSPTTPDGRFNRPIGLTIDDKGLIYVIDSLNFRIEVLSSDGKAVASIGELGDQPGTLSRPRGVAVDSFGHIYVADAAFDNVQVFNLKGQLLLVFGGGGKFGLSMPASLTTDSSDRIFAVDSFNHRIQIYQFLGNAD